MKSPRALVPALIVLAAAMRLLPHPANFLPITAMALFAGARCANRTQALLLVAATMVVSDLILGFHSTMIFVYGSLLLTVLLGSTLREKESVATVGASALASSLLFFVITNTGVWMVDGLYPHTAAGLVASFVAAIPFFENSLLADLFYTGLLFGAAELLNRRVAPVQFAS